MKAISSRIGSLRRLGLVLAGVSSCVGLASCGGHDDGTAPVPVVAVVSNTPPASASANIAGFIAYVKIVISTSPDNTQPIDLTGFVAPADDTAAFDPSI